MVKDLFKSPYKEILDYIWVEKDRLISKDKKYMNEFLLCIRKKCILSFEKLHMSDCPNSIEIYASTVECLVKCVETFWDFICEKNELINIRYVLRLINFMVIPMRILPLEISRFIKKLDGYGDRIIEERIKSIVDSEDRVIGLCGDRECVTWFVNKYKVVKKDVCKEIVWVTDEKGDLACEYEVVDYNGLNNRGINSICIINGKDIEKFKAYFNESNIGIKSLCEGDSVVVNFADKATYDHPFIREDLARLPNKPTFYLLDVPQHTNIGDYMITYAEEQFIKKFFPEYSICELSGKEYVSDRMNLIKKLSFFDIVTITGGGFFGTLWSYSANVMYRVIEDFPYKKIVVFPQSVFFEDDEAGVDAKEKARKIINGHKSISVVLRENISYKVAVDMFNDNVKKYVIPDMVLLMLESDKQTHRNGIFLCLRNDKESTLNGKDKKKIERYLRAFGDINYGTMHAQEVIANEDKFDIIQNKLSEISGMELVVTDTLHCLISCVITETPCIVLNNLNRKIEGCCEFLKELEYIRFLHNPNEVVNVDINTLRNSEHRNDDKSKKEIYIRKLVEIIKG